MIAKAEEAIRSKEQFRAAAIVERYGQLGHAERPMFDLMLRFATSEDGALHAEKYYHMCWSKSPLLDPLLDGTNWSHLPE